MYSLLEWYNNFKLPDHYEVLIQSIQPILDLNHGSLEDTQDLVVVLIYGLFVESGFNPIDQNASYNPGFDIRRLRELKTMPKNWKQYDRYCYEFRRINGEVIKITIEKDQCELILKFSSIILTIKATDYVKLPQSKILCKRFQYLHILTIKLRNGFILPFKSLLNDFYEPNTILNLPEELHNIIFNFLTHHEKRYMASTCLKFRDLLIDYYKPYTMAVTFGCTNYSKGCFSNIKMRTLFNSQNACLLCHSVIIMTLFDSCY